MKQFKDGNSTRDGQCTGLKLSQVTSKKKTLVECSGRPLRRDSSGLRRGAGVAAAEGRSDGPPVAAPGPPGTALAVSFDLFRSMDGLRLKAKLTPLHRYLCQLRLNMLFMRHNGI